MSLSEHMDRLKISSPATCSCFSLFLVCFYTKLKLGKPQTARPFTLLLLDYEKFRSSSGVFFKRGKVSYTSLKLFHCTKDCNVPKGVLFSITNIFWKETKPILELFGL